MSNKLARFGKQVGTAADSLKMERDRCDRMEARADALREALRPFVDAYEKHAEPIGDSDLYDEQPRAVYVTLGDCRKAARTLRYAIQTAPAEEEL